MKVDELLDFVPKLPYQEGYMDMFEISFLEDEYGFTIDEFMEVPNNLKTLIELDLMANLKPDKAIYGSLLENIKDGKDTTMDFVTYLKICSPTIFHLVPNKVYSDLNTLAVFMCYVDKEFKEDYLSRLEPIRNLNTLSKVIYKQLTF